MKEPGLVVQQYKKSSSILSCDRRRELDLKDSDLLTLFKVFVIETPTKGQSQKARDLMSYGWETEEERKLLYQKLQLLMPVDRSQFRVVGQITRRDLEEVDLGDGHVSDIVRERAVIKKTRQNNRYMHLMHHVRNCLCHGNYKMVADAKDEPVILLEDHEATGAHYITMRAVLRLETLIRWADLIRNGSSGI